MEVPTMYRRIGAVLALTMTTGVAGACSSQAGAGGGAEDQETASQEAESTDALSAPEVAPGANPLMSMLRASMDELDLRPEQRSAIQTIRSGLESKTQAVRDARHDLAFVVADQIASGRIDDAIVNQKLAVLVQAVRDSKLPVQDALNQLHAALDPAQRRALVDKLRDKGMALRDRVGERGGGRAVVRARLGRLADELGLTGEQKLTIRDRAREEFQGAGLDETKREEVRARLREIGQAFATEQFDARALDIGREAPDVTQKVSLGLVRFVKVVVPVLSPAQRAKLATLVKQKAAARP